MRVLHIGAGNLFGGVETMLVALARHGASSPDLDQCFAVSFDGRLAQELRTTGASVTVLGGARLSRPLSIWRANRQLRACLTNDERPDAVIFHGQWTLTVFGMIVRHQKIRLGLWLHGAPDNRGILDRAAIAMRPDFMIANSSYTAGRAAIVMPRPPICVIRCPVEAPDHRSLRLRREVRREFETHEDALVVVLVGRMEALKGQQVLLRALERLRFDSRWTCWIVGGPQRDSEQSFFQQLQLLVESMDLTGRVRFCGERRDVPSILAAADIYCQPNTEPETFGITYVEAMYASLPVVGSALGGALEIVDESSGYLTKPNDDVAVADAILSLIADGAARARLGRAGAARAAALCEPQQRVRDLAALLKMLRNRSSAHPCDATRAASRQG